MKLRRKNKYAVGQIIGAGIQLGDMIGTPIRNRAEQIDPITGQYLDYNRAVRNAGAGSIWAPHKAITESLSDPNASGSEKALSFTSLLGIPGLSKMWANKRYKRLEKEHMNQVWNSRNPNIQGTSYNPYYMAGGGITGEYAELEDGEPFMTPDGNIEMVNGNTHAQGGEDYILPEGTAILGKNTSKKYNKQFKELGERLKRMQDKHQKIMNGRSTMLAQNTSKRMLDKIQGEYNNLVAEQELSKQGKHIMPDGSIMANNEMYRKGGILNKKYKYPNGDIIKGDLNQDGTISLGESRQYYNDLIREQQNTPILPRQIFNANTPQDVAYIRNTLAAKWNPLANNQSVTYRPGLDVIAMNPDEPIQPTTEYAEGGIYIKPSKRGTFTAAAKKRGKSVQSFASQVLANKDNYSPAMVKKANFARNASKWKHQTGNVIGGYDPYFDPYNLELRRPNSFGLDTQYKINAIPYPTVNTSANRINSPSPYIPEVQGAEPQLDWSGLRETSRMSPIQPRGGVFSPVDLKTAAGGVGTVNPITPKFNKSLNLNNIGEIGNSLAQMAPIAYNIAQGLTNEPRFNYQNYLNPYIGNIRSAMRNRRYDISPELESNRIAQAVYNRNLAQAGSSPSQLYAGLQTGVVGRQRADASAISQRQNINNQYLADQAQMDYNLGRDISGLNLTGYDINQRNAAARRNFLGTATSQLQQLAQTRKLEKNQVYRDAQRMGLLKDLFSDFSYSDKGWIFNRDGSYMSEDQVMKYLKGKK